MTRRPYAAWAATRVALLVLLVLPKVGGRTLFADLRRYVSVADRIADWSAVPFRDFPWEYPPGAALAITPPAFFGSWYAPVFVLLMLLCDLAVLAVLVRLGARLGSSRGAWLWVFGVLLTGPIVLTRYDSASALLAVLALAGIASGAPLAAGIALGGGVVTKLWPALLLVVLPLIPGRTRLLAAFGATLAGTVAVVLAVGGAAHGASLFSYHSARGLQVESVAATPLVIAQRAGAAIDISLYPTSGSWDVTGTGAAAALAVSTVATALALLLVALLVWRARRAPETYLDLAATTLLVVTVTGKVLSPQYVIWLLAVFAVALCREGSPLRTPAWLVAGTAVLGQYVYPMYYGDLVNGGGSVVVVALTLRNAALVVAAVLAVRGLWRRTATP